MNLADIGLLVFICLIWPLYEYLSIAKTKQACLGSSTQKMQCYRGICVQLFGIGLLTYILIYTGHSVLPKIQWLDTQNLWFYALSVLICIYIVISFSSVKRVADSDTSAKDILAAFESVTWLMPNTKKEANTYIFGVSLSAGINEEIIFRGYLFGLLMTLDLPVMLAMVLSTLPFALLHTYQGIKGMLRVAVVGLVLTLVYWLSESLVLCIVLHSWQDIVSGLIYKSANQKLSDQSAAAD